MADIAAALAECDIEAGRPEAFVWEWGKHGIDQSSGYPALADAQACLREDTVAVGIARVITASGGGVVAGFSWVSLCIAGRRNLEGRSGKAKRRRNTPPVVAAAASSSAEHGPT